MNEHEVSNGRRWSLSATFAALFVLGCAQQESSPPRTTAPLAVAPRAEVKVVDRAGYDALVAELKGKVVLVDFWATWCAPCVEQLPHTFELAETRAGDGLAVVTVCMEDPDDLQRIRDFLAQRDSAAAMNLVSQEGGGSGAMEAFDIEGGSLPHYKLYDRTGELRHTFSLDPTAAEQFTSEDVAQAVMALIQE